MKRKNKRLQKHKLATSSVRIDFLYLCTKHPEQFIDALEQLCKRYTFKGNHNWFFKYGFEE